VGFCIIRDQFAQIFRHSITDHAPANRQTISLTEWVDVPIGSPNSAPHTWDGSDEKEYDCLYY